MSHWMFNCQSVAEKISQSMDRRLPLHQRLAIGMHLAMCRCCPWVRRQLQLLRDLGRREEGPGQGPEAEGLSQEARRRIKQSLHGLT